MAEPKYKKGQVGRPPVVSRPHEILDDEQQKFELSDL